MEQWLTCAIVHLDREAMEMCSGDFQQMRRPFESAGMHGEFGKCSSVNTLNTVE